MRERRYSLIFTILTVALHLSAQGDAVHPEGENYQLIELKTDSLPSLNVPRTGHETLYIDGEITVFGGHTDGFVPEATAEYLSDGTWATVPLVYPHDQGAIIRLRSGKVFMVGGFKEPLGIGQIYSAEQYDPTTHTSQGFGCMDKKRAFANAIEMGDGHVVIAGNWFADDGIEMFDNPDNPYKPNAVGLKDVSYPRAKPYILRISDDDAIIFGSLDNKAEPIDYGIVDRLKGQPYREPFLDTWVPLRTIYVRRSYNQFIGNEEEGRYEWLLPVENDETGTVAIAHVKGSADTAKAVFSLLPTQQPIPDSINGKLITYSSLVCDRERGMAYLIGDNDEARIFVVSIPYQAPGPAPLTIFVTEPQPIMAQSNSPVLTPDGALVFAGGHLINNFSPSNRVIRLPLGDAVGTSEADISAGAVSSGGIALLWIIIPCLVVCAIVVILLRRKMSKTDETPDTAAVADVTQDAPLDKNMPKDEALADLFRRIERLMEDEEIYLNPNLRASDVAASIGTNTTYVSAAINSQRGCSFSQFLTSYRVIHAQRLMREDPERKISTVSTLSGFTTDSTFFRAFRSITGMSPKEWLSAIQADQKP